MSGERGRRVSAAAFQRMWSDPTLRVDDIAAQLGVTRQAVQHRARQRGLPPRRRPVVLRINDLDTFAAMWTAGVPTKDIMWHFGCSSLTPRNTARRLGLPPRGRAWRATTTLQAFREEDLARRLATAAAETRRAMRAAEMVDRIGRASMA